MCSKPKFLMALSLMLAAPLARADTRFTTTNWVAGVPVPGSQVTNGSGQVYIKGNVHVHRVVCADARIAGRLTAWMDLAYQADSTALLCGPATVEPGTWNAAGTSFAPSGGVWSLQYTGLARADGSDVVNMVGFGIGGAIDGLRVEVSAAKGGGGDQGVRRDDFGNARCERCRLGGSRRRRRSEPDYAGL